ncbi:MAG: 2-phospho-L-lactate guanylyltransferase [SAR324 cluster bacterium]|nr:2-phospho-L-lactate guanylyltransferase [SAR324 cluster bacterium]
MWAVIPVKQISQAKQRLSPLLSTEERRDFFSAMLEDVLSMMVKIDFFEKIILATNCPHAISIAGRHGITHFETGPDDGLNQAAGETVNHLLENGIRDMFLIPADIPLITEEEINSVLKAHPSAPSLTIIPSRDKLGSNCILLSPPSRMPLKFGPDSYFRHQEIAQTNGLKVNPMEFPGFGLDIDEPKDLFELLKAEGNTRSQKYLRQLNLVKN